MKITTSSKLKGVSAELLVLSWFEEQKLAAHPLWPSLSAAARTAIQRAARRPNFTLAWGKQAMVQMPNGPWDNILIIGLGKQEDWTTRRSRLLTRRIIRHALSQGWRDVVIGMHELSPNGAARAAEQCLLATYEYRAHKQIPAKGWPELKTVAIIAPTVTREHATAIRRGETIGKMVNRVRDLANTPGGAMTPEVLARVAREVASKHDLKIHVLTPKDMRRLSMGALLGVGIGSSAEPRLIVLEYHGAGAKARPIIFVGKGITFDSGGYNLKPSNAMHEMHMDMAGGAAVIGALAAIAELQLPVNVVGIIPAAENMVSGSGLRPGDILRSMSGLNIEVNNTDAEGRLVLADALTYAQKFYRPAMMVDVATLTGAALVALGQEASALLTKDSRLQNLGQDIGEASGDYVWPLPMWEEYEQLVQATFGDVSNSGKFRWGGTIEGAMFLAKFVKQVPWVHLDIAPTMSSIDGQYLAPGATGAGTRWLVELARRQASGTLPV